MLSRKYYELIARVINDSTLDMMDTHILKSTLINNLSNEFKKDNSLFNKDIFVDKCSD